MRMNPRKAVLELLKLGVAVMVGLGIALYFFQDRLIFYRQPPGPPAPNPPGYTVLPVSLRAADGTLLAGWFARGSAERSPLVIYFGGNAEEVSWNLGLADRFAGWSFLAVNYRGYGASEGAPSEAALFSDALEIFDLAARRPDIDSSRIVVLGRSLGSGVAVHLASMRPAAGVILVTPYDSVLEVARSVYPFLPIRWMLKHPFDSLSRAPGISLPLLCLVAADDRVIRRRHSERLFQAWGGPKRWVEVPGADHDSIAGEPPYWDAIAGYLRAFGAPSRL